MIFVDPQALADMLEATGPIDDPALDRTLEASTVVDYLANEAYAQFGSQAERKRVLGAAALSVFRRFLEGRIRSRRSARWPMPAPAAT